MSAVDDIYCTILQTLNDISSRIGIMAVEGIGLLTTGRANLIHLLPA